MNCRTCSYPLWDLKSRTCPECSTPFAPTQYQFRRHSVAFCCPECNQPYYGSGEGGHLEPRQFTCVKCAQALHEDMMVLRPTRGVSDERTRFRPVPWFDTQIASIVSRLVQTAAWAVFLPGRLGARLPTPERTGAAVGYAAIWMALMLVPAIALTLAIGVAFAGITGVGSILFFGVAIWAFVGMFPWAGVTHLVLMATGSRRAGFGRTLACHAYAIPTCLPLAIPLLAFYAVPVVMIYWTIVSALALRAGQRISLARAFLATSVFPLFLAVCTGAFVLFVALPAYRNAMATVAAMQSTTTPQQQATALSNAILAHAQANSGNGPAHMCDLLLSSAVKSVDLLSGQQFRNDARASLAGRNLSFLDVPQGPAAASALRTAVAAATPQGTITSHRLGDAVFTYHGIDLNAPADPALWILVITTEPSRFSAMGASAPAARPPLGVARADGSAVEIPDASFIAELKLQNALRAKVGLPTLPDLRQILANGFTTSADSPALDPPEPGSDESPKR